jgi:hypothetical protein
MPQHLETLLDNIERDALGLDTSHISHIYESQGLTRGQSLPDNRNQHLRLHPDVLASAERTLSRSFELIRFTEAPKCIGAGQAPFSLPIAETSTVETTQQQQQTVTSPISSVTSTSGGAKRVLLKTGIITNEVELARLSLLTMLRGNNSFDIDDNDDDTSSAAIALAVANGVTRVGRNGQ